VQQRRYSEALDLLDSLPDEEDSALLRVTAWAEIAGSAADPETTGRALRRALTVAESIFSTTYRSIGFAELAWAEAHLGDREARQRFRRAADLASEKDPRKIFTLTGPSPRFSALKRIGERMTQAGFGDEALAIAESLAGETDSEWYLLRASLIAAVAAHGRRTETLDDQRCDTLFDQALACARKATNSIIGPVAWQAAALLSVAERLALARRWRRAFETLGEAHFTADPFVIGVGTWFEALEERASGLTLAVIAAIAEVFGWQRPDWREVALALTTPG
jgi:hypothetical protein